MEAKIRKLVSSLEGREKHVGEWVYGCDDYSKVCGYVSVIAMTRPFDADDNIAWYKEWLGRVTEAGLLAA